MITHASHFGKFPLTVKFAFRHKNIYLLPQGWNWNESYSQVKSDIKQSNLTRKMYWIVTRYQFSWLWLDIHFKVRIAQYATNEALLPGQSNTSSW